MPLPRASSRNPYTAMMITGGPLHPAEGKADELRQEVYSQLRTFCGHNLRDNQFHMAFETSDDDYNHYHILVGFNRPQKPPMRFLKWLKTISTTDDQGRKPNNCIHYVPKEDRVSKKIGAYKVLLQYITNPHKAKMCDEGVLNFYPLKEPSAKFYMPRVWGENGAQRTQRQMLNHVLPGMLKKINAHNLTARLTETEVN